MGSFYIKNSSDNNDLSASPEISMDESIIKLIWITFRRCLSWGHRYNMTEAATLKHAIIEELKGKPMKATV